MCECSLNPLDSKCGDWEGNESACICVEFGLIEQTGEPLPS